jgi:polyphosphate:AMP phosphotransferase
MFETAELGRRVARHQYKQQVPTLRMELLEVQQRLRQANFSTIVVFGGVDGAGKSETVNVLNEWMDPRGIITRAFESPSEDERQRPEYWRYWLALPPKGTMGMYLSAWYSRPLLEYAYGNIDQAAYDQALNRIALFEKELVDDGSLILKFWMHLGKKAQKKRLKALEKDPLTRWRVTAREQKHWKMYGQFEMAADRLLHKTSTGQAAWQIVEGEDHHYRTLVVATALRDAIRSRLEQEKARSAVKVLRRPSVPGSTPRSPNVLTSLDMSQKVPRKEYQVLLEKYQGRLNLLARRARSGKLSTILVFEGADAAGKGGAIRRLTAALDARDYQVIPIAAPTDEEKAHHYLWRFWRHLPRAGRVTIFDRSWYGRVLVERIEGFAAESEWRRAYAEINDFEEQLVEHGTVLVKYWIHITQEEQLQRFQARENTPYKRWKITPEDWRNREKWDAYETAVDDMVASTSTAFAPWTLVEGNDKRFTRLKILRTLCERLEQALKA